MLDRAKRTQQGRVDFVQSFLQKEQSTVMTVVELTVELRLSKKISPGHLRLGGPIIRSQLDQVVRPAHLSYKHLYLSGSSGEGVVYRSEALSTH